MDAIIDAFAAGFTKLDNVSPADLPGKILHCIQYVFVHYTADFFLYVHLYVCFLLLVMHTVAIFFLWENLMYWLQYICMF